MLPGLNVDCHNGSTQMGERSHEVVRWPKRMSAICSPSSQKTQAVPSSNSAGRTGSFFHCFSFPLPQFVGISLSSKKAEACQVSSSPVLPFPLITKVSNPRLAFSSAVKRRGPMGRASSSSSSRLDGPSLGPLLSSIFERPFLVLSCRLHGVDVKSALHRHICH